jgi:DNA-directed RNA polymerase specialized sigma24 family protein
MKLITVDQIQQLNDLDLLASLCSSHEDDLLYREFVNRFLPELEAECLNICKQRKIDHHIGKQIAHDSLEKLRKYKSFKSDQLQSFPSHKGILIYLFSIARNLFIDLYNKEKKNNEEYLGRNIFEELTGSLAIPDTPDVLQWKRDLASKIYKKLNKNEQQVVLADIEHKRHRRYLPDEVTEKLAFNLGVKKDTIRKIRERAITKIKKAIDEINQQ